LYGLNNEEKERYLSLHKLHEIPNPEDVYTVCYKVIQFAYDRINDARIKVEFEWNGVGNYKKIIGNINGKQIGKPGARYTMFSNVIDVPLINNSIINNKRLKQQCICNCKSCTEVNKIQEPIQKPIPLQTYDMEEIGERIYDIAENRFPNECEDVIGKITGVLLESFNLEFLNVSILNGNIINILDQCKEELDKE
jgi:hypothetical protein